MVGRLGIEVVSDLDALARLADEWHDLLERSPGATAFASPAWVLTWYRHFERPGGVYAVVVRRDAELVGLAPFARSGRGGFRLLVSAGTEHGDYGDPLLGPEPEPVAEALADHLSELVRGGRVAVNLRRLCADSALLAALERRDDLVPRPMGQVARAAVVRFDRLEDPDAYLERLARRHGIPRRVRRLGEDHPPVSYGWDHDDSDWDLDGALDAMRDMLRRRWEPGTGPRMFAAARLEAFTRSVLRELADAGLARVSLLRAGGRPVAVSTVFRVGRRYLSDNAAFDPELARYGLGQAELYEMLRRSLAEGAVEVDLRAGDFPYKRKWANAERVTRSVAVVAPGAAGEAALAARRIAMSLRFRGMRRRERRGRHRRGDERTGLRERRSYRSPARG